MRLLALALLALAFVGRSAAEECPPGLGVPEFSGFGHYIEHDLCASPCVVSTWVYEESNGIPTLQRKDPLIDDTCGGLIAPDTIVAGAYVLVRGAP